MHGCTSCSRSPMCSRRPDQEPLFPSQIVPLNRTLSLSWNVSVAVPPAKQPSGSVSSSVLPGAERDGPQCQSSIEPCGCISQPGFPYPEVLRQGFRTQPSRGLCNGSPCR